MRSSSILLAVVSTLLLLSHTLGQETSGKPIQFDMRLQVPVSAQALSQPLAVHADLHTGEVFVADVRSNTITVFDPDGLYRFTIPGGTVFTSPQDVTTWPDGRLLVLAYTEQGRSLVRMDYDGREPQLVPIRGLPAPAEEPWITSLALSADGEHLYLLDENNHRLWIANDQAEIQAGIDLAEGYTAKERREQILEQVDIYGQTVLVPLPMAGTVKMFDLAGKPIGFVGRKGGAACETAFPVAAALTEDGTVIILDQQRALMMVWRPSDNRCLAEVSGIGAGPGRLYRPADLAVDPSGRILVGQGYEGRVQRFRGAAPAAGSYRAAKLRR